MWDVVISLVAVAIVVLIFWKMPDDDEAWQEDAPAAGEAGAVSQPAASAPPAAPVASAPPAEALPPPKPTTLALARTNDAALDGLLAEADKAFEAGDLDKALAGYEAARKTAPRRAGPIVGAARVKVTRASPTLGFAAAEKNAAVIAAAKELKRAADLEPTFGPAFVEHGRA
ncbi:MAG: hypothetical protein KF878_33095, partial [Planctomycetes bacterium]|nr:hypothetical protein [Planctomycetota bacterium]